MTWRQYWAALLAGALDSVRVGLSASTLGARTGYEQHLEVLSGNTHIDVAELHELLQTGQDVQAILADLADRATLTTRVAALTQQVTQAQGVAAGFETACLDAQSIARDAQQVARDALAQRQTLGERLAAAERERDAAQADAERARQAAQDTQDRAERDAERARAAYQTLSDRFDTLDRRHTDLIVTHERAQADALRAQGQMAAQVQSSGASYTEAREEVARLADTVASLTADLQAAQHEALSSGDRERLATYEAMEVAPPFPVVLVPLTNRAPGGRVRKRALAAAGEALIGHLTAQRLARFDYDPEEGGYVFVPSVRSGEALTTSPVKP